jgi:hypothetical protein
MYGVEAGTDFLTALRADRPVAEWRDELMTFGQFVGSWQMDVQYYDPAGPSIYHGTWEWSFGWILGGRAIQDVIVDLGADRQGRGTTVRYRHPDTGEWTIFYLGAVTNVTIELRGGKVGDDIVLEGNDPDGTLNRWTFSDIKPDSFTWTGLASSDGHTWWRNQLMLGKRVA